MRPKALCLLALALILLASPGFAQVTPGERDADPFARKSAPAGQTVAPSDIPEDQSGFLAEVDKAEAELRQKTRPDVGAFASAFKDANDIAVSHAGVFANALLAERLNFYVQGMTGSIHQGGEGLRMETGVWRSSVEIGVANFFLTPQIVLWGSGLYEGFSLNNTQEPYYFLDENDDVQALSRRGMYRGYVFGGKLGGKYIFRNGSEVGLEGRRESIWKEHNNYDARLFNRVQDMNLMAADLAVNKARAFADVVTFPEHRLRLDGGYDGFEDGNARKWGYVHYQIPILWSRDKHWNVIRPNFYVESMDQWKQAYFSPQSHITLGCMLHAIHEFDYFDIEAEVNPQLLWTKDKYKTGAAATGVHGLLNLTFKIDAFRFGVGGFAYTDSDNYWLMRGATFLKYAF